jgi:hypothetical protein
MKKTDGVALTEEGEESEKQGEGSLKILDVDFFFPVVACTC